MRSLRVLLWPAGAVLGLGAESASCGWGDPGHWIPDLVTGWTLIACGLVAWSRRPDYRSGPLLAATGLTWFLGNFAGDALRLPGTRRREAELRAEGEELVSSFDLGRVGDRPAAGPPFRTPKRGELSRGAAPEPPGAG